eukprot:g2984.t1
MATKEQCLQRQKEIGKHKTGSEPIETGEATYPTGCSVDQDGQAHFKKTVGSTRCSPAHLCISGDFCEQCPKNTYGLGGEDYAAKCQECPKDKPFTVNEEKGVTSVDKCKAWCKEGYYGVKENGAFRCEECPLHSYCTGGENHPVKIACPDDRPTTYSKKSTKKENCNSKYCGKGRHIDMTATTCKDCSAGHYSALDLNKKQCDKCPADAPSTGGLTKRTSRDQCFPKRSCPEGYGVESEMVCKECEKNHFSPGGANAVCEPCPAKKPTTWGQKGQKECSYSYCSEGKYLHIANGKCEECPIDHYCEGGKNGIKIKCPEKEPTSLAGSKSRADCGMTPEQLKKKQAAILAQLEKVRAVNDKVIAEVSMSETSRAKLRRQWAEMQTQAEYTKLMDARLAADERAERTYCEREKTALFEGDNVLINFPSVPMLEENDGIACLNINRDRLITAFCSFRKEFDVTLAEHGFSGVKAKKFWPNICCSNPRTDCEPPAGGKRTDMVPFAVSQGGNMTAGNLRGEIFKVLGGHRAGETREEGYLQKGMLQVMAHVRSTVQDKAAVDALKNRLKKMFENLNLCGPRVLQSPVSSELTLCQLFYSYTHMMQSFHKHFNSLFEKADLAAFVPASGHRRRLLSHRAVPKGPEYTFSSPIGSEITWTATGESFPTHYDWYGTPWSCADAKWQTRCCVNLIPGKSGQSTFAGTEECKGPLNIEVDFNGKVIPLKEFVKKKRAAIVTKKKEFAFSKPVGGSLTWTETGEKFETYYDWWGSAYPCSDQKWGALCCNGPDASEYENPKFSGTESCKGPMSVEVKYEGGILPFAVFLDRKREAVAAKANKDAAGGAQNPVTAPLVPAEKGEKGEKGEPGKEGPPGKDGKDGKAGPPGADGKDGLSGKEGLPGRTGKPGLPGRPGQRGSDGLGLSLKEFKVGMKYQPGDYVFAKSRSGDQDSMFIAEKNIIAKRIPSLDIGNWEEFKAPQGERGPQGEPGQDGAAGTPGIRGASGADGAPGKDGSPGKNGAPGKDGEAGPSGPVGPQGPPGKGIETSEVDAKIKSASEKFSLDTKKSVQDTVRQGQADTAHYVKSVERALETEIRSKTQAHSCPRDLKFENQEELRKQQDLYCQEYGLELSDPTVSNLAMVYLDKDIGSAGNNAKRRALAETARYRIKDRCQNPMFSANDISIQEVDTDGSASTTKEWVMVIRMDWASKGGYLQGELANGHCERAKYLPFTEVGIQLYADDAGCCKETKDYDECIAKGCKPKQIDHHWVDQPLSFKLTAKGNIFRWKLYEFVLEGTKYTSPSKKNFLKMVDGETDLKVNDGDVKNSVKSPTAFLEIGSSAEGKLPPEIQQTLASLREEATGDCFGVDVKILFKGTTFVAGKFEFDCTSSPELCNCITKVGQSKEEFKFTSTDDVSFSFKGDGEVTRFEFEGPLTPVPPSRRRLLSNAGVGRFRGGGGS